MNINELSKKAHANAVNKGFYPEGETKNIGELLMLCVSELGEALEAHRKDRFCKVKLDEKQLFKINLEHLTFETFFASDVKDTFEDELADTVIRICDMCGYLEIDLEKHIELKMKYNSTRERLHGKKY